MTPFKVCVSITVVAGVIAGRDAERVDAPWETGLNTAEFGLGTFVPVVSEAGWAGADACTAVGTMAGTGVGGMRTMGTAGKNGLTLLTKVWGAFFVEPFWIGASAVGTLLTSSGTEAPTARAEARISLFVGDGS
jgi:hypothetical protein